MDQMAKNYNKDEEDIYIDRGEEDCSSELIISNPISKNKSQALLIEKENEHCKSYESFSEEEDLEE